MVVKKLLIIGAGYEQIKAYEIAKEMGLYVIGTDKNPNASAFEYADEKLISSSRDSNQTLKIIKKYSKKNKIDGVITVANDSAITVATIANYLGSPTISVRSAKFATNKLLMKKQFIKYKVPTAKFLILKNKREFLKKIKIKKFPLILKPSDGRGSRGVLYIDKDTDLSWAWQYVKKKSENKILILEEFLEGEQLSVEGVIYNKKFYPVGFADRNYANLNKTKPHIIEDGGVLPTKFNEKTCNQISKVIEKAAHSLKIEWGAFKSDIVLTKNGPMVIEVAARLSGNYLATHHIPKILGVNIVKIIIKMALGEKIKISEFRPKQKGFLAVRYFFPNSGKIKKIQGIKKVKLLKYVHAVEFFKKQGEIQPKITSHADRSGIIKCFGNTYEEAEKRVEDARNLIQFKIE